MRYFDSCIYPPLSFHEFDVWVAVVQFGVDVGVDCEGGEGRVVVVVVQTGTAVVEISKGTKGCRGGCRGGRELREGR